MYGTAKAFRGIERSTADVRSWFDESGKQHDGLSAKADLLVRTMQDLNFLVQERSAQLTEAMEMSVAEAEFHHDRYRGVGERRAEFPHAGIFKRGLSTSFPTVRRGQLHHFVQSVSRCCPVIVQFHDVVPLPSLHGFLVRDRSLRSATCDLRSDFWNQNVDSRSENKSREDDPRPENRYTTSFLFDGLQTPTDRRQSRSGGVCSVVDRRSVGHRSFQGVGSQVCDLRSAICDRKSVSGIPTENPWSLSSFTK